MGARPLPEPEPMMIEPTRYQDPDRRPRNPRPPKYVGEPIYRELWWLRLLRWLVR